MMGTTMAMLGTVLAAEFHPPSTEDFVYKCVGPSIDFFGSPLCLNFISFLVLMTLLFLFGLFFFAFRKATVVPGKLQASMEMGLQFVREAIAIPMLGQDAARFVPLLGAFFFYILMGNLFEVFPFINFSANSRVAFPLILAIISWVVYNGAGIKKHGFIGYLRHTCIIAAAPPVLRYTLLVLIEFVSNIIVRPITLTVRLTANFIAGHFLLAIIFGGTFFAITNGVKTWPLAALTFPLSVVIIGFEVFVAILQAFIFSILSASYIGMALSEEH
jgi:F-type H+-transporting ATPase subunit a